MNLDSHRLAELFPLPDDATIAQLANDIAEHGQREPIVLLDGLVLDGRCRLMACRRASVEPRLRDYDRAADGEPLRFVLSMNLHRRHLNESQRALVAARVANGTWGGDRSKSPIGDLVTQPQAAEMLNVGERSVQRARAVLDHGTPELIRAVETDAIPVSVAAKMAQRDSGVQAALIARVAAGCLPAQALRKASQDERKSRPLPEGKYRVIYADPPWRYNDTRVGLGFGKVNRASSAAEEHYATMSVEELCALDVRALAAADSVLFCWATFPLLPDCLSVVAAWGFTYKTAFVWHKQRGTFGHYHKADAELLLVATRGSCVPDIDKRLSQIIDAQAGAHSRKPDEARALIDTLYEHGARIELFARRPATGWTTWGNELAS